MTGAPRLAREILAAGLSTALGSALLNPWDVCKVRMQGSALSGVRDKAYESLWGTARQIVREEGALALWRPGLAASFTRDMLYSGAAVGLYPATKRLIFREGADSGDIGLMRKVCSGLITGGIFSGLCNPADLVKIRMQGEAGRIEGGVLATGLRKGFPPTADSSLGCLLHICKAEGVSTLYRGTGITALRAALGRGAQLASYDHTKHLLHSWMQEGPLLHVFAAFVSGVCFATAAAPADIVKTRYLNDGEHRYKSALDCWRQTVREFGVFGLYRGWLPSVGRTVPLFCLASPLMEAFRVYMGVGYY